MAETRFSGPLVVHSGGVAFSSGDSNPTPGPSAFVHGVSLLDQRFGAGASDSLAPNWYATNSIYVLDQAPATLSATNIVAAAVPVAGTAMTLAGASTGITVLASPLSLAQGMTFPTGSRVIDGNPALLNLGALTYGMGQWDPRTMIGRCLRFTSVGNDSTGTAAVVGVDVYGQLVHETVTLANATVATSKKALKAVISITPGGTLSGANLSVGTSDVYGFPLAAWEFPLVQIYWNNALISATTGFTAAVATTPTAITGDVRGTYGVQSASDGTKILQVFVSPAPWQITLAGLFGATQF